MRRFVLGDIHGAYKALMQCLERSSFDYDNDLLISLGDICDGWPETKKCIDELLKIKHIKVVLGNHDEWALEWMITQQILPAWLTQGGRQTMESYDSDPVPKSHIEFLNQADNYLITKNDELFVHAGLEPQKKMEEQDPRILLWDRSFYNQISKFIGSATSQQFTNFKEVYIGHTPIHRSGFYEPLQVGEVWLMDTGAAWDGVLSLMDIDTKEVYTSDKPIDLYPPGSGRF